MSTPQQVDFIVVGGGPAGSVAALIARRAGVRVLLVEQAAAGRPRVCAGWMGPPAVQLAQECGATAAAIGAVEFRGLQLWSWDLARQAAVDDPELGGWIVDRARLDAHLLALAKRAGAEVRSGVEPRALRLGESRAHVTLSDGSAVEARVIAIADGVHSATARLANLATARPVDGAACAYAVLETRKAESGLQLVLGAGRTMQQAVIVRNGRQARVSLATRLTSRAAREQLVEFLQRAAAKKVLEGELTEGPVERARLAGAALEMDAHVGKGCLLVGDAGGFVACFSNEGIFPAMRSGWIAAETAARALGAPLLQDELANFRSAWRADLAEYLRMPNTDLSLLLPLVFSNSQMSKRVARAFLLGQAL